MGCRQEGHTEHHGYIDGAVNRPPPGRAPTATLRRPGPVGPAASHTVQRAYAGSTAPGTASRGAVRTDVGRPAQPLMLLSRSRSPARLKSERPGPPRPRPPAATPDAFAGLDLDRRRAVVEALLDAAVVAKAERRGIPWTPDRISFAWRSYAVGGPGSRLVSPSPSRRRERRTGQGWRTSPPPALN